MVDARNVLQHDYLSLSADRLVDAVDILRRETHEVVRALALLAAQLDRLAQERPA